MRKLLLIGWCILLSFNSIADNHNTLSREEIDRLNKELLAKAGIYVPDSTEINIVSAKTILFKNNATNKVNDDTAKEMQAYLAMNAEQKRSGYVKDKEPRAKELLDLENSSLYHKKKYRNVFSFKSTHLRETSDELKLGYTFLGVPKEEVSVNIGVAPYGAYKEVKNGDDADGWDGAVQFFVKNGIGTCAFTEHNRKLARTGVELIKELVTYEIHDKPTIILVKGTQETGFVYKIEWYDSMFNRELECANSQFSQKLRAEVIELANRIDSYQLPK
ncbi:TPA: hypothetical protein ACPSKE_002831 [Legionella feeleii]